MLKKIMAKASARKKNGQKGFTLIELLAVIVILAILAAIAIPSIISIIHNQSDKAKVQDAITIIHAAKLYVADNQVTSSKTGADALSNDDLKKYIDDNNISISNYTVSVIIDSSTNKATYTINSTDTGLPSPPFSSGSASESSLITFNRGN
jgi:prepilin-type N-terminal cleavage/methylation domain